MYGCFYVLFSFFRSVVVCFVSLRRIRLSIVCASYVERIFEAILCVPFPPYNGPLLTLACYGFAVDWVEIFSFLLSISYFVLWGMKRSSIIFFYHFFLRFGHPKSEYGHKSWYLIVKRSELGVFGYLNFSLPLSLISRFPTIFSLSRDQFLSLFVFVFVYALFFC